jgi:hypothetical protein
MNGRMATAVLERLAAISTRTDELSPSAFDATMASSPGRESRVAELTADAALSLRNDRIKLAIPAYESFETAGDGSTQTFSLGHSVIDTPDTQSAVVSFGGDYQGVPSVDFDANEITVDGPGTAETVHAFYLSDAPATIKIRKESANGDTRTTLFEGSLSLIQQTNQNEQPERLRLGQIERFVATDMTLFLSIDAPYVVRFEDPDGDGATATNALTQVPLHRAEGSVRGLREIVEAAMAPS